MMKHHDRVSQLTPEREDPVIHRYLASLPRFAPREGFEDRVMALVWQPAPLWLRRTATAGRRLFSPGRLWVWAGGLATASAASLAILIGLAVRHAVQLETTWSVWVSGYLFAVWRDLAASIAGTVTSLMALEPTIGVGPGELAVACFVAAAVLLLSLWGLVRVLQQPANGSVTLYASR